MDSLVAASVGLLLLASLLVKPLVVHLDPQLAMRGEVAAYRVLLYAHREDGGRWDEAPRFRDPWGQLGLSYLDVSGGPDEPDGHRYYSAGPNEVDEQGRGDDVTYAYEGNVAWGGSPLWTLKLQPNDAFVGQARAIGLVIAGILAFAYMLARSLPGGSRGREIAAVVGVGLGSSLLLAVGAVALRLPLLARSDAPWLVVPLPLAVLGTLAVLCLLTALAARLAHATREEAP
jgi:hypothetical protein